MFSESTIKEAMRELFPNGDPKFLEIMMEQINLYNKKNKDYASAKEGEAFDPNGNFNRVARFFSMYPGISPNDPRTVCLTYIMKQMDQVAWSLARGFEGSVEGLHPRLQDIAVYTVILMCINAEMQETNAVLKDFVQQFNLMDNNTTDDSKNYHLPNTTDDSQNSVISHINVNCIQCQQTMTLHPDSKRTRCWSCEGVKVDPLDSDRAWCQCGCGNTVIGHEVLKRGLEKQGIREPS